MDTENVNVINEEIAEEEKNPVFKAVEKAVFEELRSIIKAKIMVNITEGTNGAPHNLHIFIVNFSLRFNDDIKLYDGVPELMAEKREYVKTIVVQTYEKYRKFVLNKFFVHEVDE